VAVGGEHKGHIQPLAVGVGLALIQAVTGRQARFFGLDQGNGNRLGIGDDL